MPTKHHFPDAAASPYPEPPVGVSIKPIPVVEIYGPVIQGEGTLVGVPTLFVRFGGCDYRCSWCDSLYAVLPEYRDTWEKLTAEQILERMFSLAPPPYWVTLSGGNPALFDLEEVILTGQKLGYKFALETQGSIAKPWFRYLDHLTISPKPPSSGNVTSLRSATLALCAAGTITRIGVDPPVDKITRPTSTVKIVVFDEEDYRYARAVRDLLPPNTFDPPLEFCLSVGNAQPSQGEEPDPAALMDRYRWLIDRAFADGWHDARILPQLHVLAFGNRRGV
jgi:7-carboxy-7-deazaguanine synthase